VLILSGLVAISIAGYATYKHFHHSAQPQPTPLYGNTTHDQPTNSQQDSTVTPTPSASNNGTLAAKPSLQKSSGNAPGSSVPAGALIEFTCEGIANLQCEVILTDQHNASRVLNLGAKTIAGNGRGQYFATWDWTALAGSWQVIAKMSDTRGNASLSSSQTLEVR
jgi:hypothetical protein